MATLAFDLDGTLIDSVPHIHHGVATALTEMGLPTLDRATTQTFVGRGLPNLVARVLDHIGQPQSLHADLYARTMHHYVTTPADPAFLYPGVLDTLDALAQHHRLTLCTNKPFAAAQTTLADTGLARYFDIVLGGDSLPTRKPAPDMLFAALDGARDALYFGDSETDCETAQAAGVRFVLYTEGYRLSPPEALPHLAAFSDWSTVPALVLGLLDGASNVAPTSQKDRPKAPR